MLLVTTGEIVQMVHQHWVVDLKKNSVLVPISESTELAKIQAKLTAIKNYQLKFFF
jgi:hypothetical protein